MDDVIKDIIEDLRNNIPDTKVKHYFYGKPEALNEAVLTGGAIMVIPMNLNVVSITTGLMDQERMGIKIVLAKNMKTDFYRTSSVQSAMSFLVDVMDGRQADRSLRTNTIRYMIRNKMRSYGLKQEDFSIEYNTDDEDYLGSATATLEVVVIGHVSQPV